MKKGKWLAGISLAIVAIIGVILALVPSDRGVTKEHFERLRPGMTEAEVEHLLHGPPRNGLKRRALIWLPQAAGRPISAEVAPVSPAVEIFVKEDKPKGVRQGVHVTPAVDFFPKERPKSGRQAVWTARTGLIAVYFGRDGRLRYQYLSTVHEPVPPSLAGWLASRPRMIRRDLGF